jgi:hypothetical protein
VTCSSFGLSNEVWPKRAVACREAAFRATARPERCASDAAAGDIPKSEKNNNDKKDDKTGEKYARKSDIG